MDTLAVPADVEPVSPPRPPAGRSRSRFLERAATVLIHVVLVLGAIVAIFPFYWLLVGSLQPVSSLFEVPPNLIPEPFSLENYRRLFETTAFTNWFVNSTLVALLHVVTVVPTAAMAGYAFAKFSFRGERVLFVFVLGFLMIPFQVLVVPLYIAMIKLHWTDSYLPLVLPFAASPFGVFLMRQWMVKLPTELLDAARVDGAGEWRIFRQIAWPLSKPALVTVAILEFLQSWNSFLWPALMMQSTENFTLPVGIANFVLSGGAGEKLYGPLTAASVLTIVPIVIGFLLLQRQFVSGLIGAGSIKG